MDRDDWIFALGLGGTILAFIATMVLLFNTMDEDTFNQAPNGCYVHEHDYNHFGKDSKTLVLLCPAKE